MSRDRKSDGQQPRRVSATADAITDTDATPDVTPAPSISQNAEASPYAEGLAWMREHVARWADDYAVMMDALHRPADAAAAFVDAMHVRAKEHADVHGEKEADRLFYTDLFAEGGELVQLAEDARALLAAPLGLRLFSHYGGAPSQVVTGAAFGLTRREGCPVPGYSNIRRFRCDLTGEDFTLPAGSPVPCVHFEWQGIEGPEPAALLVHPALFAEGEDYVRWALYQSVFSGLHQAMERLREALENVGLLGAPLPSVTAESAAWAFRGVKREPVESTAEYANRMVSAGWYTVPKEGK